MVENLRIGSGPTTSFSASLGRSLLTSFRRGSHRPEWLRGLGLGRKPPLEKKTGHAQAVNVLSARRKSASLRRKTGGRPPRLSRHGLTGLTYASKK
jgi:hypothetical protein